jgi:hypothetical protein
MRQPSLGKHEWIEDDRRRASGEDRRPRRGGRR